MESQTDTSSSTGTQSIPASPMINKKKLRKKLAQLAPITKKDSTESIKIKNLQQTLPTELQEVILDFKKAVIDTLDNYERKTCKKNPRPERKANIEDLKKIITDPSINDFYELTRRIGIYFLSTDGKRKRREALCTKLELSQNNGFKKKSASSSSRLQDAVNACIADHTRIFQAAKESLVDSPMPPAKGYKILLDFTLEGFFFHAIDKYLEKNSAQKELYQLYKNPNKVLHPYAPKKSYNIHRYRLKNILDIRDILHSKKSTKNKIIEIKNYLKSNKFKHTFLSDFKKNILDTLDYFETLEQIYLLDEDKGGFQKETQTLYWSSSSNTTRTAVLFIPGWSDCAEAGQGLAPYVQEAGMDMFSFDLWGHGKDDQRPELCNRDNTSSKKLAFEKSPADILAIHLRAFINYITSLQQYDNIVIVAHSLGASLTINNYLSTIENNPKIKGTILLTPAIVQHILSLLNPDRMEHPSAPTGRYFSSEPLPLGEQKQKTDKMPRRMGSTAFALWWELLYLMRYAFNALKRLFSSGFDKTKFHIYGAGRDHYNIHKELNKLIPHDKKLTGKSVIKIKPDLVHAIPIDHAYQGWIFPKLINRMKKMLSHSEEKIIKTAASNSPITSVASPTASSSSVTSYLQVTSAMTTPLPRPQTPPSGAEVALTHPPSTPPAIALDSVISALECPPDHQQHHRSLSYNHLARTAS